MTSFQIQREIKDKLTEKRCNKRRALAQAATKKKSRVENVGGDKADGNNDRGAESEEEDDPNKDDDDDEEAPLLNQLSNKRNRKATSKPVMKKICQLTQPQRLSPSQLTSSQQLSSSSSSSRVSASAPPVPAAAVAGAKKAPPKKKRGSEE